jgi:hypothetical protein
VSAALLPEPDDQPTSQRFRITLCAPGIELRGWFDTATDLAELQALAAALRPFGVVVADLAEPDYSLDGA